MPEILDDFKISYKTEDDKHFLTFAPTSPCNYPEKTIEITYGQWSELKYHFLTGISADSEITRLAYVK